MDLSDQLQQVACNHPFAHLGGHYNAKQQCFSVRVWLPEASKVTLLSLNGKQPLAEMQQHSPGLFSVELPGLSQPFAYALQVQSSQGDYTYIDPYQFQQQAYHAVHYVDHDAGNLYRQVGAQLVECETVDGVNVSGCRFAVFAPNASAVSLVGDFNGWDGRCHPMQKTSLGYWVLFMPGLQSGERYKFRIKDTNGHLLPDKADPVGFAAEPYPSHASLIYDHSDYQWQDDAWQQRAAGNLYQQPMSIYEVHLASWRRPDDHSQRYLSYRELAHQLVAYVSELGFTHIEVLPVSEYPFDGSWGYQPVGLFAPTSRFGSPDEFKYFVDYCHQHDIGVIIDWVPAHFPADPHGLARFDGKHLYEYADPRKGWHQDWNSCIYDFGNDYVRQFLVANALYWLDKFHVDGLRVDAVASMLYLDYSRKDGEWVPNVDGGNHNYEAISLLQWMNKAVYQHFPKAVTIAEESTSFAGVSRPVEQGGLGFGFKWNMGWMHDSLSYISKDPAYRRYHHQQLTFSMVYAYDESFVLPISHDEVVHGKGSLLGKMPGDEWQQAANLRAFLGFMYGHPGKKLNFMGNELGQATEWDHDAGLPWSSLDSSKHRGIQQLVKALNQLYTGSAALHQQDHIPDGFSWLDHDNAEQSVLSFVRLGAAGEKIYVLCNFTPLPRDNFRVGVQEAGDYQMLLNSDDHIFGGSGYPTAELIHSEALPMHNQPHSISVNLPPLATLFIAYLGSGDD